MTGKQAAERVKSAVKHFGKLVELNAYGDVHLAPIARRQAGLRSGGMSCMYIIGVTH